MALTPVDIYMVEIPTESQTDQCIRFDFGGFMGVTTVKFNHFEPDCNFSTELEKLSKIRVGNNFVSTPEHYETANGICTLLDSTTFTDTESMKGHLLHLSTKLRTTNPEFFI